MDTANYDDVEHGHDNDLSHRNISPEKLAREEKRCNVITFLLRISLNVFTAKPSERRVQAFTCSRGMVYRKYRACTIGSLAQKAQDAFSNLIHFFPD